MKLLKKSGYLLIFYFIPLILFSQKSVLDKEFFPSCYLGITGGYGLHTYQESYSVFEKGNPCGDFSDGDGKGIIVGITFEYLLSKKLSIVGDILYEDRSGSFKKTSLNYPFLDNNNVKQYADLEQNLDITLNYLTIMPSVKYKLLSAGLGVTAGIGFNLLMSNSMTMNENILSPSNIVYIDGSRTKLIMDGDIQSVNSFTIDAKAGIFWDLTLSPHVMISPRVLFSYPVLKVTNDYDWKIQSLEFLLTLNYGL
jgi:hypothetical protein